MKLRELVLSSTNLSNANSGESSVYAKTIQNAVVIISMLPPMIVYPMLQKYFVTGVTMGAVKEWYLFDKILKCNIKAGRKLGDYRLSFRY